VVQISKSLSERDIKLEITDEAKNFLGEKGYDPDFGARPLRRVIQNLVEDPLSESILRAEFQAGDAIKVDCDGDKIVIRSAAALSRNGSL